MEEKVGIVGAGKLGGALARALCEAGVRVVAITDIILARATSKAQMCGDDTCAVPLAEIPNDLTMVLVAVSDDTISRVARFLADSQKIDRKCVVAHTSGVLSSSILSPLKKSTKLLASIHPVQTFSGLDDDWKRFFGIYYGLEGDQHALPRIRTLVDNLRGREVEIPADKKELYHLSCIMASNFLIALQAAASKVMTEIGIAEDRAFALLEPLINATLDNIKILGPAKALTGPIVRHDIGTIERHIQALSASYPQMVPMYSAMSQLIINLLLGTGGEDDEKLLEIERLLKETRIDSNKN